MATTKRLTLRDVRHVRLEPVEYIKEFALQPSWTCTDMGCYRLLIDYLYTSGGYMEFNLAAMANLCRCTPKRFRTIWNNIGHKFTVKDNRLHHKRVLQELMESRRLMQIAVDSGRKGARQKYGTVKPPNRSEGEAAATAIKILDYINKLPRLQCNKRGDRSALNNMARWVQARIEEGEPAQIMYAKVTALAKNANGANSANPFAVFFAGLSRELGYKAKYGKDIP